MAARRPSDFGTEVADPSQQRRPSVVVEPTPDVLAADKPAPDALAAEEPAPVVLAPKEPARDVLPAEAPAPVVVVENRPPVDEQGSILGTALSMCVVGVLIVSLAVFIIGTQEGDDEDSTTFSRGKDVSKTESVTTVTPSSSIVRARTSPSPANEGTSRAWSTATTTATGSTRTTTTTANTSTTSPPYAAYSTRGPRPPGEPTIRKDNLVCAVSSNVTEGSAYPPDRLCDHLYYESMSGEQRSGLPSGLDMSLEAYTNRTETLIYTEAGVSFSINDDSLFKDYHTDRFFWGLGFLWQKNVQNIGMLNVHGRRASADRLIEVMEVLEAAYRATSNYFVDRHVKTVVGLAIHYGYNVTAIRLALKRFKLALLIFLTHVSFPEYTRPDCRILPASMLKFPNDKTRTEFKYGLSIDEAGRVMQSLVDTNVSMAISFTMRARSHTPEDNTTDNQLFQPCQKPAITKFQQPDVSPLFFCLNSSLNVTYVPGVEAAFTWNPDSGTIITFETAFVLVRKICAAANYTGLPFPIAVYDVQHGNDVFNCPALNLTDALPYYRVNVLWHLSKVSDRHSVKQQSPESLCLSYFEKYLNDTAEKKTTDTLFDFPVGGAGDQNNVKLWSSLDSPVEDETAVSAEDSETSRTGAAISQDNSSTKAAIDNPFMSAPKLQQTM